jgi:hypothetical protein
MPFFNALFFLAPYLPLVILCLVYKYPSTIIFIAFYQKMESSSLWIVTFPNKTMDTIHRKCYRGNTKLLEL